MPTLFAFLRCAAPYFLAALLSACGGGGGGETSAPTPAPTPKVTLAAMIDSFGRIVPESDFGGDDGGASGGDGTAGDGAGIPNASVRIVDAVGRSIAGVTNADGYFRLRIDGFTPPFVASVTRANGQVLYSPSVTPVKVRGFVTINITGLTDKLASDVAIAAGRTGASQLTPSILAANTTTLQAAKVSLNTQLAAILQDAGLNAATFDPVTLAFKPDLTGHDKVLESVVVTVNASGATVVVPKYSISGTISGLGNRTGLSLGLGTETLNISANATTFTFSTLVTQSATYAVVVRSQPTGLVCAASGASGVVSAAVTHVSVTCSAQSYSLGGSVSGLGSATGLVLSNGGQTVAVAANATGFQFANPLPEGSSYSVAVQSQPSGRTCSVSNGAGTVSANVSSVAVNCSTNAYALGGSVAGLTASGLTLGAGGQSLAVASGSASYTFPALVATGTSYSVTVTTQPSGLSCTLANSSGVMPNNTVNNANVSCVSVGPTVSTRVPNGGAPPIATFVANDGTIYYARNTVHDIQRQLANGTVVSIGGNGVRGSANGIGINASFDTPEGIAADSSGNVYVADTDNHKIRKYTAGTGAWSDFAGSGAIGSADGTGTIATFNFPSSMTIDAAGNLYVAGRNNSNSVRKITPAGVVTTRSTAWPNNFMALAIEPLGRVYARTSANELIFIDMTNGSTSQIGSATVFTGGIASDSSGNIYATDFTGHRVYYQLTRAGNVAPTVYAGTGVAGSANGLALSATFSGPYAISVVPSGGFGGVYVGDYFNNSVRYIAP